MTTFQQAIFLVYFSNSLKNLALVFIFWTIVNEKFYFCSKKCFINNTKVYKKLKVPMMHIFCFSYLSALAFYFTHKIQIMYQVK